METVNVHDAKTHFSRLLDRAQEGQEAGGPARAARATGKEAPAGPARRQVQDPRRLQRAAAGRGDRRLRRPSAVRILLDTHLLLWSVASSRRLPKGARSLILDAANEVFYSAASVWEVAIKSALRRRDFKANPTVLVRALAQSGFSELPLTAAHAARVAGLPAIHRDPFDRMLVAQSLAEPMTLLTNDAVLVRYGPLVQLV